MIVGVGTDLIEIARIKKMVERRSILTRIFTERELELFLANISSLAGNFAVKEAVSKMFGTGFFGIEIYEIEVLRNELGAPYVVLHGAALKKAQVLNISQIHVSITNTKDYASAFVVGEER